MLYFHSSAICLSFSTSTSPSGGARVLEVRLLGQFDVKVNSQSVVIPSRPAQSLLAYLILNAGTSYRREQLAGLLWPDTSDDNARSNLRHALWRIRKAIESKQTYLVTDDLSIRFDPDSQYQLDVRAIERDFGEDASAESLIDALAQYRGELLPGFYDEWITLERERLQAIFERKIEQLLDRLIAAQRWTEALDWGERWIALGQSPEPAYRAMMQAHSAMGNIAKVAATFERCVEALRNDLHVEPSEQTRELYRKLLKEQSAAAASISVTSSNKRTSNIPIPLTSFIGRERQLAQLHDAFQSVLSGKGVSVYIRGVSGMGKSTLVQTFLDELKQKKMLGMDFDRQRPMLNYIVDFYCKDLMLAIEVDGDSHDFKFEQDKLRQSELEKEGVTFLRFEDIEVKHNMNNVLRTIESWITLSGK